MGVARRRRIFFGFRARFLQIPLYFERFRTANSLSETGSIFSGLANQGSITLDGPLVWQGIHQTGGPPNLGSTKPGVHQSRAQKNQGSTKPGVHLLFPKKPGVHGPPVYRWTGGPSATLSESTASHHDVGVCFHPNLVRVPELRRFQRKWDGMRITER